MEPFAQALWVWNDGGRDEVNQYVEFRHEFTLEHVDETASLFISVDSEYAVWINGAFADAGQYDDYPEHKAYDCLHVGHLMRPGKNVLCILAYYQGENSFQYVQGNPGLIYRLVTGSFAVCSGDDTYCRKSAAYVSGPVPKSTQQMGFTFEYDASRQDAWLQVEYIMDTMEWRRCESGRGSCGDRRRWYPRPILKLEIKDRCQATIVSQGLFLRHEAASGMNIAELMQQDYLSYRLPEIILGQQEPGFPSPNGFRLHPEQFAHEGSGVYLVIDLGREECGWLELELETESGVMLDIAYGEHLDDLRVRSFARGRNFAARYRCKEGSQTFTYYWKRWACRYIQVHISGVTDKFILHYAGLRPVEYPVTFKGEFVCSDLLHQQIEKVAVRTLHLCMHEHYEDTPWREQALYAMDARNQALCGYYSFGEYEFPAASFRLLGEGLQEDDFLPLTAPSAVPISIPSFSFLWMIALEEHLLYSGNVEQARAMLDIACRMLDGQIDCLDNMLLPPPEDARYWHFYDWAPGMSNWRMSARDPEGNLRIDAPLNLFFVMALESAGRMASHCDGFEEKSKEYLVTAESVKKALHAHFWDDDECAYRTYRGIGQEKHYAELTQALALCAGVCPERLAGGLRLRLADLDNGFVPATLSYSFFKYMALLGEPDKYATAVFDSIAEDWGGMLYRGATSFWETKKGAADFNLAGSLCHGWSAIPIYFYYAYVLGIRPVEPGFKSFRVEPVKNVFHQASGTVPTPYGDIRIVWKWESGGWKREVTHPEGIQFVQGITSAGLMAKEQEMNGK